MKTENEIKSMSLEERQKLVIELRTVPAADKFYAVAKTIMNFIQGLSGRLSWREPQAGEVINIADHDVTVDGQVIAKGATAKIFPWQAAAMRRWLEPTANFETVLAARAQVELAARPPEPPGTQTLNIAEIVATAVAETLKQTGKAKAVLLLLASVLFGLSSPAQVQSTLQGSPGSYHVYAIGGYNGGTNSFQGTNYLSVGVTNLTYITNANWVIISGIATNQYTVTTNQTVNYPGIMGVVNEDMVDIFFGYATTAAGTGTNAVVSIDTSDDDTNWCLGRYSIVLPDGGTAFVSTNLTLSLFGPGYLRFNYVGFVTGPVPTNIVLEVSGKSSKTGPF